MRKKTISSFSELLSLGVDPVHEEILKKYSILKGCVIQGGRNLEVKDILLFLLME